MKKAALYLLPLLLMACGEPVAQNSTAPVASTTVVRANTTASVSFEIPANARMPESETWQGLLQQATHLRTYVENTLPHTTPEQADALFEQYFKILSTLLNKLNKVEMDMLSNYNNYLIFNEDTGDAVPKPELLAKQRQLAPLGLDYFLISDGQAAAIFPVPDHYLTIFGKRLSPNYHHLMRMVAKHGHEVETVEGEFVMSFDKDWQQWTDWKSYIAAYPARFLIGDGDIDGQPLADWEEYIAAAYPNDKWQPYVECQVAEMREAFLVGLESDVPVFQEDGTTLRENAAQAWQNFVQRHPNSPTTAIIQSMQDKVSKKNMVAELKKQQVHTQSNFCEKLRRLRPSEAGI